MKNELLEYELIEVDKLIPYVNNARVHSDEQVTKVMASIKEFGFLNPILISDENVITAGHCRLLAAKKLGLKKVPCIKERYMTKAQRKAYVIADNKLALGSSWDDELLKVEIESLKEMDFDIDLLGFEASELDDLLLDDEVKEDNFDVANELEKPCITKRGDIWILGNHRLYCGDSTKKESYEVLMAGKKANLVVTDPPYNVNYEGSAGKIKNDNMTSNDFYKFLFDAFSCMELNMADDASIYVFHADTEGLNFRKAFKDAGFYLSGTCIWKKQSLVLGRSPYQWQHEPCLFGWKKKGKHKWYGDRKQTTIWEFDKPKKNGEHPTMKPIPLIVYAINNSSLTNSIVLDPFGGSGSTLIACAQTNRSCYTMELDEKFCDVIVKRYIEFNSGNVDDVYLIRDGNKVKFSDV